MSKPASFPLRLPKSLKDEIERVAREDGVSINQFIVTAAAQKLSAMEAGRFFAERAERADMDVFWRVLNRQGGEPPREGDELPAQHSGATP